MFRLVCENVFLKTQPDVEGFTLYNETIFSHLFLIHDAGEAIIPWQTALFQLNTIAHHSRIADIFTSQKETLTKTRQTTLNTDKNN